MSECGWPKLRVDGVVVVCGNTWVGWCVEWPRHQAYVDRFGLMNMRTEPMNDDWDLNAPYSNCTQPHPCDPNDGFVCERHY